MVYPKQTGAEPFPGYRLIEFLGRGGFGEVWKCEVPGGLFKAIKFVREESGALHQETPASQELEAFERIKSIRHPFLLSVERVEFVGGELITVTELADKNLFDRLKECQVQGLVGIPRDELLGLMLEAAEALDVLNLKHGLQHLDIKPSNLFLIGNHLKVADFGLVRKVEEGNAVSPASPLGPVTPLYCPPEVFQGKISDSSDQYSLAIVYQELLTGTLPFEGSNSRQLMLKHVCEEPNLQPLPEGDRPVVSRALAKDPAERYGSCLDFLYALLAVAEPSAGSKPILRPSRAGSAPSPDSPSRPETPTSIDLGITPVELGRPWTAGSRSGSGPSLSSKPAGSAGSNSSFGTGELSIPGYQLVECVSQYNPVEMWKVRGTGNSLHLARLLPPHLCLDADQIKTFMDRLRNAQHPALPVMELVSCSKGIVLLARDCESKTLQQCFQESVAAGLPGIPRDDLLNCLAHTAEALDQLRQEEQLWHLGLNPFSFLIEEEGICFTDFGLIHLLWLPSGLHLARCYQRYAAPELLQGSPGDHSDQYSLAMLFAEMVSGVHPRLRFNTSSRRMQCKLDLALLSTGDQRVLAKALRDNPERRFASCTELVQALRSLSQPGRKSPVQKSNRLAPVVPVSALGKDPLGSSAPAPALQHLVKQIFEQNGLYSVDGTVGALLWRPAENTLDCKLPLRRYGKTLRLKLQAFCEVFGTTLDRKGDTAYLIRLHGKESGKSFWSRLVQRENGLAILIEIQPAPGDFSTPSEATVHIAPIGTTKSEPSDKVKAAALELLNKLLPFLDVVPDQRMDFRLPFAAPVQIYPVGHDLKIGEPIPGRARNLSLSGAGLELPQRPATSQVYLHFPEVSILRGYALLARIVHVNVRDDATFEIGVSFLTPAPDSSGRH